MKKIQMIISVLIGVFVGIITWWLFGDWMLVNANGLFIVSMVMSAAASVIAAIVNIAITASYR